MAKGNAVKDPITGLTAKKEQFVQNIVAGQSFMEAYKNSYDTHNMTTDSCRRRASALMQDSRVRARLEALREPAQQAVVAAGMITLEDHLAKLAELRDEGVRLGQVGPAVTAEVSRGKAAGFYIERRETGQAGEFQALGAMRIAEAKKAVEDELNRRARLANGTDQVDDVIPK